MLRYDRVNRKSAESFHGQAAEAFDRRRSDAATFAPQGGASAAVFLLMSVVLAGGVCARISGSAAADEKRVLQPGAQVQNASGSAPNAGTSIPEAATGSSTAADGATQSLQTAANAATNSARPATDPLFDAAADVLQRRCLRCHNDIDRKGEFSLQTVEAFRDSGYFDADDPAASELLAAVTAEAGETPRMPKNARPLTADQLAALRRWLLKGARWPSGRKLTEPAVADRNWWSLQPLRRPAIPVRPTRHTEGGGFASAANKPSPQRTGSASVAPPAESPNEPPGDGAPRTQTKRPARRPSPEPARNPIDAFVDRKLAEHGLQRSPAADRRTLMRRVCFDVLGLPPEPDELDRFAADPDPLAYEKLVDRLLASPQYGERWGRHWLDVAKYADTCGYDKDKLRPNAWPYRDYVIRSFNEDKPYSRFVQEQIAGDVLFPGTPDGILGLGFLAAGPWDFIGHVEVPESKLDGRVARNLDRDDFVSNTINTFCSLTVQCARCHNHKFDPITQRDYYGLQAVFAAIDRADRVYDTDPATEQQRDNWETRRRDLLAERKRLAEELQQAGGEQLQRLRNRAAELAKRAEPKAKQPQYGYHSAIAKHPDAVKWVEIDLGREVAAAEIVLHPCHDEFAGIGAGFGFPVRYAVAVAADETIGNTRNENTRNENGRSENGRSENGGAEHTGVANVRPANSGGESSGRRAVKALAAPTTGVAPVPRAAADAAKKSAKSAATAKAANTRGANNGSPGGTVPATFHVVADRTKADAVNPGLAPVRIRFKPRPVRFVRVTATRLAERKGDYIFAFAELEVRDAAGNNLAQSCDVRARDSIEAPVRWARKNLTDGIWPQPADPDAARQLADVKIQIAELQRRVRTPERQQREKRIAAELAELDRKLRSLPSGRLVYAAATDFRPQGNFHPTGGKPREIHVLHRGNLQQPLERARPGALPLIPGVPAQFDLPPDHSEGDRRAALAHWLTHPQNPLTWRSIANRVWQYHFGRGLVETPNDFGRMGALPTHPQLLDWLACELRDTQSLKHLHRLILTSAAYRQASAHNPQAAEIDAGNQFLWRMNRRRLEAEELRDAILAVSGRLNPQMGGPGFYLFVLEKTAHSPHYEYHKFDPRDPASHRRSVYRFVVRSQPDPFMTTLDCADSSQSTPRRNETLTALQALSLLNNRFNLVMAEAFAQRLQNEATAAGRSTQSSNVGRNKAQRRSGSLTDAVRNKGNPRSGITHDEANSALPNGLSSPRHPVPAGGETVTGAERGTADDRLREQVVRAFRLTTGRVPAKAELDELTDFAARHGLANLCRVLFSLSEFVYVD